MTLRIERFDGTPGEWDAFARSQPGWSLFHLFAWKRIVEAVHGHECPFLVARDAAGALVGALPLVRVRSLLFGHYLVSMPFVSYGGPLGSEAAIQELVRHTRDLAQHDRVKLLELRSRTPLPIDLPVSYRKITVLLDLPGDVETFRRDLGAKLRSQIKRPEKEGVSLRFGAGEVEPFFQVFSKHMRDLGTPVQPLAFFRALAEYFGDAVWFACAYHQGRPVAGGAGFRWEREVEITWAASLREYNAIAPNMLLYRAFMERAIGEGVSLFNFGRCTPGSGTHRFKRQWGSRDQPLSWYQWAEGATPDAATGATPSPDQGSYALAVRVWQHLPVSVATALGPRIVRGIP